MLAWLGRLHLVLAAAVCLFFAAGLRDTPGRPLAPGVVPAGPRAPVVDPEASAGLVVAVQDPAGGPIEDAAVSVYALVDGAAVRVGEALTDASGRATLSGLPPGEAWLVVRADDRARSSSRLVLEVGPARERTLTLAPAMRFEVVVVDTAERPIPGVSVELFGADPLSYRASSDARGLAAFEGLGPEPWAVEVSAPGFDGKLFPNVEAADSPFFVKLERLGSLEVVVVGPDGQPIAGAKVLAAGSALWPARTAESDASGRVRIAGLPRGFYELRAESGALVSGNDGGVMLERGEQKKLELRLEPGVFVHVHVVDPAAADDKHAAVAQADVALVTGGLSSFPLYGRTDGNGDVTLGPIAGDDATVSVRARGFVARNAVPLEPGTSELEVAIVRGATVTGEVVDDRGFPVAGVSLEAVGTDLDGMPVAESSATTDFRDDHFAFSLPGAIPLVPVGELGVMPIVPDLPLGGPGGALVVRPSARSDDPWVSDRYGRFALAPVPPGRVRLVARHPSYAEALSEPLTLAPGGEAVVKLVLRQGAVLEGRVLEADRTPAAGARVALSDLATGIDRITYTADDGTFAYAAVGRDATVSVTRGRELDEPALRIDLTLEDGVRREIEVTLPERRDDIALRVTDDRGYPLDRVEIRTSSLEPAEPLARTLFTSDSGRATLTGARGLPLRIVLVRPGKAPAVSELDPTPGEVDLVMLEPLAAEGTITARRGYERVEDAEVTLWTPVGVRRAKTDKEGLFAFADLGAGAARLFVHKSGYAPRELSVVIGGEPGRPVDLGRFELEQGGAVRGVVRDADDKPIAGARVALGRVPTYLPLGPLPPGLAGSDARGRFTLFDLPPGTVSIEAYVAGVGRSAVGGVVVRPGETTEDVVLVLGEDAEPAPGLDLKGAGSLAVTLGETGTGNARQVRFEHVPQGGEAERAGIEPGDRLLAVDGVPVRSLEQARKRLTGPIGEELVATLARGAELRWRIRVKRERIRE
ncbi:MAG: carboxypeptidase regulatory-like domain-containing protein [Polyangiaceae bacterium]|nr:carboxypeptidase regulatory-like domain-containing protein [Polyangiaceae bacterium]